MFSKNKIVVIHIDSIRREYLSSWLLGEKFKERGYNVLLSSRHSTWRLLKFFTPTIFVSTHPFTLKISHLENLIKRGTKIYVNEVEGTDNENGVSSTYPEFYLGKKIDYNIFSGIFVWGEFTYNWLLEKRKVKEKNLFLNGSIRQSKFCRPIKKQDNEIVVGIISRFEIINTYDGRHPFENLVSLDPEDVNLKWYYERCAIDSEAFSIVVKLIKKLIENGYRVSFRPHPNENIAAYDILKRDFGALFTIDNSYNLNEWLSSVSIVLGNTSTAFIEPFMAGIPIISISKIQKFNYTDTKIKSVLSQFDKAAYLPDTIDNAYGICTTDNLKPQNSDELDIYFNKFYSLKNNVDPIENIINIIGDDTKHIAQSKSKMINSFIIQYFFLLICDVLLVIKYLIFEKSFNKLKIYKNYNYNRIFHRPSIYMKKLNHNI